MSGPRLAFRAFRAAVPPLAKAHLVRPSDPTPITTAVKTNKPGDLSGRSSEWVRKSRGFSMDVDSGRTDSVDRLITADDVRDIRQYLRDDFRGYRGVGARRIPRGQFAAPEAIRRLATGAEPSGVRAGLAETMVQNRGDIGLSAADVSLWWSVTGLTSDPVAVTEVAEHTGLSRRTIERRIRVIDQSIADLLNRGAFVVPPQQAAVRSEANVLALWADAASSSGGNSRSLDAIQAYVRRSQVTDIRLGAGRGSRADKDHRYRDSLRVPQRLETMARRPPLLLRADQAIEMFDPSSAGMTDPMLALELLESAQRENDSTEYETALRRAERLIPDRHVLGLAGRLRFLEAAFTIMRDAENLAALRYAIAWESEATHLTNPRERDLAVLKARAGQAHILQMFGRWELASHGYRRAVVPHMNWIRGEATVAELAALHDTLGQIAFTETLRRGPRRTAERALLHMARIAELAAEAVEIEFTLHRREFEVLLGYSTSSRTLRPLGELGRKQNWLLDRAREQFFNAAERHAAANRRLSAADLAMCWAIRERDWAGAAAGLSAFTAVHAELGGFANLSYRMQSRIIAAQKLWPALEDLPGVPGLAGPWRAPGLIPKNATGLLVYPARHDGG
ncbi:hypothetical protein [Nocardia gipuzkoensis]